DENEQSEEQKNNESTEGDNNETDDGTQENQSPAEDQLGLKLGETGVVENSNGKYEVTVNSVRYVNTIGDNWDPETEVFVIADVLIKNIGEETLNSSNIVEPALAEGEASGYTPAFSIDFLETIGAASDLNVIGKEIESDSSIEAEFVFDTEKHENYKLAFGTAADQIITRSEWKFSDEEVD